MNFRFPIFLDLSGKTCVVTGEGHDIPGKIQALIDASAVVIYVNPEAEPLVGAMSTAGLIEWRAREFKASDLDDCFLVIADSADNSHIFQLAEEKRVLCNAADDPENCRFSFGALHRQGDLTIAISTNGIAPALAVRLKETIKRTIGSEYEELLKILSEVRPEIAQRVPDFQKRRELWYRIIDSSLLTKIAAGRPDVARQMVNQLIDEATNSISHSDTSADSANL